MQIVTNALVHRVVFDGKRAVGVEFSGQSGIEHIDAAREVILSAGAIGSPHLLQLSGVGEPEVLKKAGIAVRHPLPGVGQNFQDHYIARVSCYVRDLETLNERARGIGFANEIMRYLAHGMGMMTFGTSLCAASVKVLPESATPDVQCVFAPASYKPGLIRKLDDRPGITGGPWQIRPLSRGYVLVRTPDPRDQPAINPRYLAEDTISARWSAGSSSCGVCSSPQHSPNTSSRRTCRDQACRAMTNCSITRARMARPSTTPAARA